MRVSNKFSNGGIALFDPFVGRHISDIGSDDLFTILERRDLSDSDRQALANQLNERGALSRPNMIDPDDLLPIARTLLASSAPRKPDPLGGNPTREDITAVRLYYDQFHKGTAGSFILACLVCGASHCRGSLEGCGSPSWCVDCCSAGRSVSADGRVIPVLKSVYSLWEKLWLALRGTK